MSATDTALLDESIRRKSPAWLPYGLIALGGAAVVVPIFLLRRLTPRDTLVSKTLSKSPPPPIRRVTWTNKAQPSLSENAPSIASNSMIIRPKIALESDGAAAESKVTAENDVSGPWLALKALGIATCIVGTGAIASIFAVRIIMGIDTVEDFSSIMRNKVQKIAPILLSRIYRLPTPGDDVPVSLPFRSVAMESGNIVPILEVKEDKEWTWDIASERLSKAYQEGGLDAFLETAGKELEREANIERRRRKSIGDRPQ